MGEVLSRETLCRVLEFGEAPRIGIMTLFAKLPVDMRVSYFTHFLSNPDPYIASLHDSRKVFDDPEPDVYSMNLLQYFFKTYSNVLSFTSGSFKSTSSLQSFSDKIFVHFSCLHVTCSAVVLLLGLSTVVISGDKC